VVLYYKLILILALNSKSFK